jgi:hypothetical protein
MRLVLTAKDAVLHLKPGDVLEIALPPDADEETLNTLADNIRMGSLLNQCKARAGKSGGVELVAVLDCTCFGFEAKKDEVVLDFDAPGSVSERAALGEAIRTAKFIDRFAFALLPDEAAAPATDPAKTDPAKKP